MYSVDKIKIGTRLTINKKGLPKSIVFDGKTSQAILKQLFELGVDFIKNDNGSDNKK